MLKKLTCTLSICFFLLPWNLCLAQKQVEFSKYHSHEEIQKLLEKWGGKNTSVHQIAESPGGKTVSVLEIGTNLNDVPAIFVGANFEGNIPLASEGALYLAKMLIDSSQYTQNLKWYIMPQPNPDAAAGYFADLKSGTKVNGFPINNDADDAINEDDFDDLNGDGFITQMRVKDIEGQFVVSAEDKRLMRKANLEKGERGEYKLYSEGFDNDKDGNYNEDGMGGINVGIAFPHLFPREKSEAGMYAGETPEVYGILRFIFDRPEIAMVYTLGSSNFCLRPPKGGRKGEANLESIKLSGRYARMLGAESGKNYKMNEIIEMAKTIAPEGVEITPSMIAGMLGLGAAVNPQKEDLKFYEKFAKAYEEHLKAKGFKYENLEAQPAKNGSFELWAYYHLGVPSFSMNLFSVPKPKESKIEPGGQLSLEDVKKLSADEFMALEHGKIESFLQAHNAPKQFSADKVLKMMESGKVSPARIVQMVQERAKPAEKENLNDTEKTLLKYSDIEWEGKGFVEWTAVNHPGLGRVEVGGFVPYLATTPKPEKIEPLLRTQVPWLLSLSQKLPSIGIQSEKLTRMGTGVYKLEVFIENKGELPYPIAMGQRNNQPAPIILAISGDVDFLEGKSRTAIGSIGANQVNKYTWILQTKGKKPSASIKLESTVFTDIVKQINIGS